VGKPDGGSVNQVRNKRGKGGGPVSVSAKKKLKTRRKQEFMMEEGLGQNAIRLEGGGGWGQGHGAHRLVVGNPEKTFS